MKGLFFLIPLLCGVFAMAQTDSTKPSELSKDLRQEQLKNKNNFNYNLQLPKESLQLQIQETRVKELQLQPLSVIVDPSESISSDRVALIINPTEEEEPLRRRLVGPSQFDSRIEVRALDPLVDWQKKILDNGRSVALVVRKEQLAPVTDSLYKINTELTLKQKFNLCPGEPFGSQPVAGEGTAFLMKEDLMMTAGHVLSDPVDQYAIVFGFEMRNKVGDHETLIPITNIYYPVEMISHDKELDVAVMRLDRPADRPPLKIWDETMLVPHTEIYMIGHPSGLPQKIALNASVSMQSDAFHFYTTLDAFQGNSGSPVFDFTTHEVIGVLVSGETDYVWTGNCNTSVICKLPYCKGEKAVKIREALKWE